MSLEFDVALVWYEVASWLSGVLNCVQTFIILCSSLLSTLVLVGVLVRVLVGVGHEPVFSIVYRIRNHPSHFILYLCLWACSIKFNMTDTGTMR